MTSHQQLEDAFHARMRRIYEEAKAIGYPATRFIQMVEEMGGLATAQVLLASDKPSDGLTHLWEKKRLDLSLEAVILEEQWHPLFSDAERAHARRKLQALGYEP